MNVKRAKKMRGFMCQSPSLTAACMANDPRSVIVPRSNTTDRTLLDHARLANKTKYNRLVEPRGHTTSASTRSNAAPSMKKDQDKASTQLTPSLPTTDQLFQVVVMRVSLHCQGCAGKVKRHLSKMEGVTSFSIDLESKRVTVMGNVSPVGVLESISKVKRAEFWPC